MPSNPDTTASQKAQPSDAKKDETGNSNYVYKPSAEDLLLEERRIREDRETERLRLAEDRRARNLVGAVEGQTDTIGVLDAVAGVLSTPFKGARWALEFFCGDSSSNGEIAEKCSDCKEPESDVQAFSPEQIAQAEIVVKKIEKRQKELGMVRSSKKNIVEPHESLDPVLGLIGATPKYALGKEWQKENLVPPNNFRSDSARTDLMKEQLDGAGTFGAVIVQPNVEVNLDNLTQDEIFAAQQLSAFYAGYGIGLPWDVAMLFINSARIESIDGQDFDAKDHPEIMGMQKEFGIGANAIRAVLMEAKDDAKAKAELRSFTAPIEVNTNAEADAVLGQARQLQTDFDAFVDKVVNEGLKAQHALVTPQGSPNPSPDECKQTLPAPVVINNNDPLSESSYKGPLQYLPAQDILPVTIDGGLTESSFSLVACDFNAAG